MFVQVPTMFVQQELSIWYTIIKTTILSWIHFKHFFLQERTKNAQFIIISLRNNMFELADRLVGIYKTHDCTKSVTINPKLIAHQG